MNISSIVVKTTQESFESVKNAIKEIQGCEIYIEDKATNQLIVVIESQNTEEEVAINKHIESMAGVMSAKVPPEAGFRSTIITGCLLKKAYCFLPSSSLSFSSCS